MANLPETSQWDAGIYQIETSDPVLGGVNGIANLAAKNLANRTLFLKNSKADKANTLAGYGISDALTQAQINTLLAGKVDKTVTIASGTGLTGGGDLSSSRTLAIDKATTENITAGTANKVVTADIVKPLLDAKADSAAMLGIEQTWQDVKNQRANNVAYTNTTGKPIQVFICANFDAGSIVVDGVSMAVNDTTNGFGVAAFIVPIGSTYRIIANGTHTVITSWMELR